MNTTKIFSAKLREEARLISARNPKSQHAIFPVCLSVHIDMDKQRFNPEGHRQEHSNLGGASFGRLLNFSIKDAC